MTPSIIDRMGRERVGCLVYSLAAACKHKEMNFHGHLTENGARYHDISNLKL